MADPEVAIKKPAVLELEPGKSYWWCACGRSKDQPFCDGSHTDTGMTPNVIKAEKDESAWFCLCKQTENPPFCDGTHKPFGDDQVGQEGSGVKG